MEHWVLLSWGSLALIFSGWGRPHLCAQTGDAEVARCSLQTGVETRDGAHQDDSVVRGAVAWAVWPSVPLVGPIVLNIPQALDVYSR